ncbi:MAG: cell wall-binding repeat-containing protein [Acidimicrobiia bacterium]|nr:MAG: cell wall-binding repeat-containing protein [Acidimicrobiia bacterium]
MSLSKPPALPLRALLVVLVTLMAGVLYGVAGADSPDPRGTEVAYIATGTNFPDALGAGPAAALGNGPILLVQTDAVPSQTTDELNRLKPRLIVIVGGTAVVSTGVENTLKGLSFGPTVLRVSGANRYATAAAISESAFPCGDGEVMAGRDRSGGVCQDPLTGMWSIQTVDSGGDVGIYVSLVLDAFGDPVISYRDETNTDLMLARCSDPACSGTKTITTLESSNSYYPSLALDSSGLPVISYYDAGPDDLELVRCNDLTCGSKTTTTVDSSGSVGLHTSLVLDSSGFPVISYRSFSSGDLKLARCHDATCTTKTIATVEDSFDTGYWTSLVLDTSGFPIISYYDASARDLRLARCADLTCSSKTLQTVDSEVFDVGKYSSLALDRSGFPIISYYDVTNADLKVARCSDAACTTSVRTAVDPGNLVGTYTSLVLDVADNPVISYYDEANGDLKLAHCRNPACTSGTVIVTVPSLGDVGKYSSLALDPAGNPVIAYYDGFNTDLALASF